MAATNNRVRMIRESTINGVDSGGMVTVLIQEGWDQIIRSGPSDIAGMVVDRECQFVRGAIATQDWSKAYNSLVAASGNFVFSERISGAAAGSAWQAHTLANTVIHRLDLAQQFGQYMTATYAYECKFASDSTTYSDVHSVAAGGAAGAAHTATRGGYRVESATLGEVNFYHVTQFNLSIALPLFKDCNDGDVGYTIVEAETECGIAVTGSITVQDEDFDPIGDADPADLVLTLRSSSGAADKTITVKDVVFTGRDSNKQQGYGTFAHAFEVSNPDGDLTLSGETKFLTIA